MDTLYKGHLSEQKAHLASQKTTDQHSVIWVRILK